MASLEIEYVWNKQPVNGNPAGDLRKLRAFICATAASLAASAASAADAPITTTSGRPAEYVRVCSTHGEGFFTIPGTDNCLRISGRARAEMRFVPRVDRAQDVIGFNTEGRVNIDSRTSTEYGLLRAYLRIEAERSSGAFNSLFSEDDDDLGVPVGGGEEEEFTLSHGYIQFAGLTAGRAQSFFDFYENELNFEDLRTSDESIELFAYTASFGKGFSATLSFESPKERQASGTPLGGFPFPTGEDGRPRAGELELAGMRIPDIVGNVRVEQDWGEAQISGALHEIAVLNGRPRPFGGVAETQYGFAAQAGAMFKLPFLGEDDELWLQASYARGAVAYLALADITQIGGVLVTGVDGFVDPTGQIRLSTGFASLAALLHHWTPTVRQSIFGGYARLEYPDVGQASVVQPPFGRVNTGLVDFNEWRVGSNLIWEPVDGLEFGAELLYTKLDPRGHVISAPIYRGPEGFEQRRIDASDVWIGRTRITRNF